MFCFTKKLNTLCFDRGEKAFCSADCRHQEIVNEEEFEKPVCEIFEHSSTSRDGIEEFETHGTIFE